MKKFLLLLLSLTMLLSLSACISKDATEKLQDIVPPITTDGGIGGTDGTPTAPVELISNGDFSSSTGWTINESGDSSWGGTGGDIDVAYDTGAASITIVRGDSSVNYEAQFYQTAPLVIGKTYTVSFEYSADVNSPFVFSLEKEGGNPCYLSGSADDKKAFLTASTTVQTYTNTFTASETNDVAKVLFLLSSAPTGAKITIDKVSLKETTIE